jgi:hypothetical protein
MARRNEKNDWFERKARRMVRKDWFVSVEMPKHRQGEQAFARRTETFPTETEAKQFAKEMLSSKKKDRRGHVTGRLPPGTSSYLRLETQ